MEDAQKVMNLNVRMPVRLYDAIGREATRQRTSMSYVAREALEAYLSTASEAKS